MKNLVLIIAVLCAALTTSTLALLQDGAALPQSRAAVKSSASVPYRTASSTASSATASASATTVPPPVGSPYIYSAARKLQLLSNTDSHLLGYATADSQRQVDGVLVLVSTRSAASALWFNFEMRPTQGFPQGLQLSPTAPVEYWGRIVASITTASPQQQQCLWAAPGTGFSTYSGQIGFEECDDQDQGQWWRLQRGSNGDAINWYPQKYAGEGKYNGNTMWKWSWQSAQNVFYTDGSANAVVAFASQ